MPRLLPCPTCGQHHRPAASVCPHCAAPLTPSGRGLSAAALVLGLALGGCAEKDGGDTNDTNADDTAETGDSDTAEQSDYGVAAIGFDEVAPPTAPAATTTPSTAGRR